MDHPMTYIPVMRQQKSGVYPYGNFFLIENLNEIIPKSRCQWGLGQEPHWESRTSSRTSSKVKNLIKNQDLGQDLIEIFIEILNEKKILIENLNENLNEVLPKILIFDEVFDEVLDSQSGSCPRPHWDFNFGTISLRFSIRKTKFFRKATSNTFTLALTRFIEFHEFQDDLTAEAITMLHNEIGTIQQAHTYINYKTGSHYKSTNEMQVIFSECEEYIQSIALASYGWIK